MLADSRKLVSADSLREVIEKSGEEHLIQNAYIDGAVAAQASDSMQDILPLVAGNPWALPIVDSEGQYLGAVSKNLFLKTLHRNQNEELNTSESATDGAVQ